MMEKMAGNMIIAILRQMGVDPEQLKTEVIGHVNAFQGTMTRIEQRLARIEKSLGITDDLPIPDPVTTAPEVTLNDSIAGNDAGGISPPAFPGSEGIGAYPGNSSN